MRQEEPPRAVDDFLPADAVPYLSAPTVDDNKYSRGVLGIMSGSSLFPGAAILGVEAASRTGVGMIRYHGTEQLNTLVLQRRPEIVITEGPVHGWLIGSGIDAERRSPSVTAALIEVLRQGHLCVVDAGALDLIDHATGPVIITPHYGELARLLDARGVSVTANQLAADPADWARRAANHLGVTVLLKGNSSYCTAADDLSGGRRRGAPCFLLKAPTTELAVAGSGDVLAGILAALVVNCYRSRAEQPWVLVRLAAAATMLHGRAAFLASRGAPIVASDIAEAIPHVIAQIRRGE